LTNYALLGSIFILAITIRIPTLGVPLSGDEATTFWEHTSSSWITLFSQYNGPNQHSLFSFLSNISIQIFGENETSFRLPSFIAGVLIIPFTYIAGNLLLKSQGASLFASLFVCLSEPLFEQSLLGRGYTLTAALALIFYICGKNITLGNQSNQGLWSLGLIFFGCCMVLTLPSNIYFLVSCGTVILFDAVLAVKNGQSKKNLLFVILSIVIMGCFAVTYLLIIYQDLQQGVETYRVYARTLEGLPSLELTFDRSLEIFLVLSRPWGVPMFLLFLFGLFKLRKPGLFLFFLLPFTLNYLSGIQGPPRSYYYWAPFILLFAANGLIHIIELVKRIFPQSLKVLPMAGTTLFLLVNQIEFLQNYFDKRFDLEFVKMEEGEKARHYISGFSKNHLFVFPYNDKVLRYYIEKQVAENMLKILQTGELTKVTFLGHKALPTETIPVIGSSLLKPIFSTKSFSSVKEIGSLKISSLDFSVIKFIPLEKDFNFQSRWGSHNLHDTQSQSDREHKIVDKESLKIIHEGQPVQLLSRLRKRVSVSAKQTYVLYIYAKRLRQESRAGLFAPSKVRGYFNYLFGIFREEMSSLYWEPEHPYRNFRKTTRKESSFYWQIIMAVNPLAKGEHIMQESLWVDNETSYFDGFQAFFLQKNIDN
jgi:hypothetical protein